MATLTRNYATKENKRQKQKEIIEKMQKIIDQKNLPVHFNMATNKQYSGTNVLFLEHSKIESGFKSNFWLGFNQATKLGYHVIKGSIGTQINVFSQGFKKLEDSEETKEYTYFKSETVFNLDQLKQIK